MLMVRKITPWIITTIPTNGQALHGPLHEKNPQSYLWEQKVSEIAGIEIQKVRVWIVRTEAGGAMNLGPKNPM